MKHYNYGRRQENRVAQSLRSKGAKVTVSPGSRGAADLTARFSPSRTWKVQVKSSRGCSPASPCARDIGRLKISASRSNATPVISKVTPRGITFTSARNGRTLRP
jgi:hypothetical protein